MRVTDRPINRQTDGRTDRRTDRHAETDKQAGRQTKTDKYTERDKQTDIQAETQIQRLSCSILVLLWDRLVGLVVKAPASRAEDPGFESRLRREFIGVESYQ